MCGLSSLERDSLIECVELLNESERVRIIAENIEDCLSDTNVLHALCEVCHNLMIYNKMAIFEYKYYYNFLKFINIFFASFRLLYTLAFMPNIIRAVWFTLASQSSQLGFNAPLSLISKGVVRKYNY